MVWRVGLPGLKGRIFREDIFRFAQHISVSYTHLDVYKRQVQTGWGADYGDPQNYLGQMTYGNETAYFPNSYNYVNEVEVLSLIHI